MLVADNSSMKSLADMVILNIQHLMDAMATVCKLALQDTKKADRANRRVAKILQSDAKITHDDLDRLLQNVSAQNDQLIELLRIFNILLPAERINSGMNALDTEMIPTLTSTPKAKNTSKVKI